MNSEETFQEYEREVNEALARHGIQSTIDGLRNPEIYSDAATVLLDLFRRPYGGGVLRMIAVALFRRPMSPAQREEAIQTCLQICRRGMGKRYSDAELIAGNELADNAGPQHAGKIGEMFLNKRLGENRDVLALALGKIADSNAISYLRAGAKDAETANLAITELARLLRPVEAIQICDAALALSELRYRKNVEEIRAKLERKLKRRQPTHLTDESPPEGLEEWSANIDGDQISMILRAIRKLVEQGFGKSESDEIRTVMDDMSPKETKTLKFKITFAGEEHEFWTQIYCDDEDAFDLYAFGPAELIHRMGSEIHLK